MFLGETLMARMTRQKSRTRHSQFSSCCWPCCSTLSKYAWAFSEHTHTHTHHITTTNTNYISCSFFRASLPWFHGGRMALRSSRETWTWKCCFRFPSKPTRDLEQINLTNNLKVRGTPGCADGWGKWENELKIEGNCHFGLQKPTKQVYAFATESWESAESKFTALAPAESKKH